jgi:Ca2+/Na+ antiporter
MPSVRRHDAHTWRAMTVPLLKAIVALLPASILLISAILLLARGRTVSASLQVAGAASLVVVVLCHVFEALNLFPWMGWGLEHSAGHYLDLSSAILGLTLFPVGYMLYVVVDHGRGTSDA